MPIAEIITAIATIGAGALQYADTKAMNKKALSLQEQEQNRLERESERAEKIARDQMKQSREQSIWDKNLQTRSLDMQQGQIDRARMDKAANRYAKYLNSQSTLDAARMAGFQR